MGDRITPKTILLLAAESELDPRTVRSIVIEGRPPRSKSTRAALAKALRTFDLPDLAAVLERDGRIPSLEPKGT